MTTTISEEYRSLNAQLHNQKHEYGNSAKRLTDHMIQQIRDLKPRTILDYGCGKESFWKDLRVKAPELVKGLTYYAYDPAIPKRANKVKRIVDFVVCTDVLEHIEPEYLPAVLREICETSQKVVYFNIATKPSHQTLPDGRDTHLIVKEGPWWKEVLQEHFPGWAIEEPEVLPKVRNYTAILRRPKEEKLSIACFYWQGPSDKEYSNREFKKSRPGWSNLSTGSLYIRRLYNGVRRNLKRDFDFILFSNERGLELEEGIEQRSFKPLSWGGCFPKLWAHSPEANLKGRVLVFDLDSVIVGDLSPFADYDGPFITRGEGGKKKRSGGDLLGFPAGDTFRLWENYVNCSDWILSKAGGGDERVVYNTLANKGLRFWEDELPGMLVSYKGAIRKKGLSVPPKQARVVTFHGQPRPHEIVDKIDWVKEHWEGKEA